jgi:Arc/MetJ-type ribon-helix-helix transcriptional regulator
MADLTLVLTGAAADKLRKLVAEERYARAEDAVADALDALDASRDAELDAWLRDTIAARAEALAADPGRTLTPQQVRDSLRGG